jgi:hypothetical protein
MLYTGFMCLAYNGVHMVTLFKNVTNIFTVLGEFLFFSSPTSLGVMLSLVFMGTGAFLSALHDLEFSVHGVSWMLLNCLCTAGYILYLRYVSTSQKAKASKMEMVLYNNFLSFLLLSAILLLSGDVAAIQSSRLLHDPFFWQMSVLSGLVGGLLSFSTFWCISATSATTYSTVGTTSSVCVLAFRTRPTCSRLSPADLSAFCSHRSLLFSSTFFPPPLSSLTTICCAMCAVRCALCSVLHIGALTKIPLVAFGVFYSNQQVTTDQALFMTFGVTGGMLFTYIKYTENQQNENKPAGQGGQKQKQQKKAD